MPLTQEENVTHEKAQNPTEKTESSATKVVIHVWQAIKNSTFFAYYYLPI